MSLHIIKKFSLLYFGVFFSVSAFAAPIPVGIPLSVIPEDLSSAYGNTKIECDIYTSSTTPEKIYIYASCNDSCYYREASAIPTTMNGVNIGDAATGINASIKGSSVVNKLVFYFKFLPNTGANVNLSFRKYTTATINVDNCHPSPELGQSK